MAVVVLLYKSLAWLLVIAVPITFLVLDRLETGNVTYLTSDPIDGTQSNFDRYHCGYNTITYWCVDGKSEVNICHILWAEPHKANGVIKFKRWNIDDSYGGKAGKVYYAFSILAFIVSWMMFPFMMIIKDPFSFWKASKNTKYFTLFLGSSILSSIALIFANIMLGKRNCATEIYDTATSVGQGYYTDFSKDNFNWWPGVSFLFLCLNWIVSIALSIYFGQRRMKNKDEAEEVNVNFHRLEDE